MQSIEVSTDNNYYTSDDGILFNKEKTEIISYPCAKSGTVYTIPNGVTKICDTAFISCGNIESVNIPETVTEIGAAGFCGCNNLKSIIIPDTVLSVGPSAFSACQELENVSLGCDITTIEYFTFYECTSLAEIIIPKNITSIGFDAFPYSDTLTIYCYAGAASELLEMYGYEYKCFGDLDNDKELSSTDIVEMRKSLLGLFGADYDQKVANINQDDNFDILDLIRLKKELAKI